MVCEIIAEVFSTPFFSSQERVGRVGVSKQNGYFPPTCHDQKKREPIQLRAVVIVFDCVFPDVHSVKPYAV